MMVEVPIVGLEGILKILYTRSYYVQRERQTNGLVLQIVGNLMARHSPRIGTADYKLLTAPCCQNSQVPNRKITGAVLLLKHYGLNNAAMLFSLLIVVYSYKQHVSRITLK